MNISEPQTYESFDEYWRCEGCRRDLTHEERARAAWEAAMRRLDQITEEKWRCKQRVITSLSARLRAKH